MGKPGPAQIGVDFMGAVYALGRVKAERLVVDYDFSLSTDEIGEINDKLQELWGTDCRLVRLWVNTPAQLIPLLGGKLERRVTVTEEVASKTVGNLEALRWYFDEGLGVDTGSYDYPNPGELEGSATLVTAKGRRFTLRGYGALFEEQLRLMGLPAETGRTVDTL